MVAYLCKGETHADLACSVKIDTSTVYRYLRAALNVLADMVPTLEQAIKVAKRKAFVILEGHAAAHRPSRQLPGAQWLALA